MLKYKTPQIGEKIRHELIKKNMQQNSLLEILNTTPSTITKKLDGTSYFTYEEIEKIAKLLDIPIADLLEGQPGTDLSLPEYDNTTYKVPKSLDTCIKEDSFDTGRVFSAPSLSAEMPLYAQLFEKIQQLPERKRIKALRKMLSDVDLLLE